MKRFLFLGAGLVIGAGAATGITYIVTKNACEKRCQSAIDEIKNFYESDKHSTIKGFVKEEKNEKTGEKEFVRNDKPNISEMSSLYNSSDNNSPRFTNYSISSIDKEKEVDEKIKSVKEKIKDIVKVDTDAKPLAIIDREAYTSALNSGYLDRDYSFEPDTEEWTDEMSGVIVDIEDLPFDPGIVQWNDLEQCYILDEGLNSVYMLEKI